MGFNITISSEVRRAMTRAFAADGILKYGAVSSTGHWLLSCGRKERSISLASNRKIFPNDGWRPVAMRDWVDWDYYRQLRHEGMTSVPRTTQEPVVPPAE